MPKAKNALSLFEIFPMEIFYNKYFAFTIPNENFC